MKSIKLTLLAFSALLFAGNVNAQEIQETDRKPCGTSQLYNEAILNNPALQLLDQQNHLNALEYTDEHYGENNPEAISYYIPVVFHIIHDGAIGYVTKAQVEASLQNLNDDFQLLNTDQSQIVSSFTGIAADSEVEFRLARLDHNGNCTEGITWTESPLTTSAGENLKSLVNWNQSAGVQKYIQIWVALTLSSGAGGYTNYPGFQTNTAAGIVIRSAQLGNSLTHEIGHYLNLPHCWGNSNDPGLASNCSGDDGVADTPNTIGNQSCNTSAVSCSSLDNVQNYMEYSFCERMFTQGQKSRMHAALNSSVGSRSNLWSPSNRIATGTDDPYGAANCAPTAKFSSDKEFVCEGDAVTFTDDSYNATPNGWNWTFAGGTPATSSVAGPVITYNTAGVYSVTHEPSSTGGTATPLTKTNIITVSSLTAQYVGPFIEDFEELTTSFSNDWWVINNGGQTWASTSIAAKTGLRSVRIRNHFTGNDGEEDELISPSYDLSTSTVKTMTFEYAFAKKTSADTDKLLVYYSTNCGATWLLKLPLSSSSIATASNSAAEFAPSAGDWVKKSVSLSSIGTATNVRFKFAFTSGGGSNVYLDDINVGGVAVGIDDFSNIASFSVYPNPTSSSAQISFNLTKDVNNLSIKVKNAVGQEVTSVINSQSFDSGKYTLKIDEQRKLSSGIYFIEFNADNNIKVQKLIVQ
jgi:hypothetical protein